MRHRCPTPIHIVASVIKISNVQFSVGAVVEPKRKRLIGVQDLGLGRRRLYKHT